MRRFRLALALELVAAIAVGFAITRYEYFAFEEMARNSGPPRLVALPCEWAYFVGSGLLACVVLVEGTAIWVEAVRKRSPRPWSWGRIAVAAAPMVWAYNVANLFLFYWIRGSGIGGPWFFHDFASACLATWVIAGRVVAAVMVTAIILRPRGTAADGREWVSRFAVLALVLTCFAYDFVLTPFFSKR